MGKKRSQRWPSLLTGSKRGYVRVSRGSDEKAGRELQKECGGKRAKEKWKRSKKSTKPYNSQDVLGGFFSPLTMCSGSGGEVKRVSAWPRKKTQKEAE